MMSTESIQNIVAGLPQLKYLPENRLQKYIEQCKKLELPLEFYLRRLAGIGASEVASIFHHYFPTAVSPKHRQQLFKSAQEISLEKMLLVPPSPSTKYTRRGQGIEQFTRDCFTARNGIDQYRSKELMQAASRHADRVNNPYNVANPDDAFALPNNKRLLAEYKSSVEVTTENEFPHVAQVCYMDELAASNGQRFDEIRIVALHTSELMFEDLVSITERRHDEPEIYRSWVNLVAHGKGKGIQLVEKPVISSPALGRCLVETAHRFFNEYPARGRFIKSPLEKTVLVGQENDRALKISAKLNAALALQRGVEQKIESLTVQASELMEEIGKDFDWPTKFGTRITGKKSLNRPLALNVLKSLNYNMSTLYSKTDRVDVDKLISKFIGLGGTIDQSVMAEELDINSVKQALSANEVDLEDLYSEDFSVKVSQSRKANHKDLFDSDVQELSEVVELAVDGKSNQDLLNIEQEHVESFSMGSSM